MAAVVEAVLHQIVVWLGWRAQLGFHVWTKVFGDRDLLAWCLTFFPLLLARFTVFLAVEGPAIDYLILAGPASALLATVWALVRRRERANLMVCALCLMVHILGHLTLWLGAGRPRITLG